jgi:hypothetical protein
MFRYLPGSLIPTKTVTGVPSGVPFRALAQAWFSFGSCINLGNVDAALEMEYRVGANARRRNRW